MIPGINDRHLVEVNKAVKSRGAFLHNIMPLISAAEHGTVFGLTGQRGPTAQELKALQDSCEGEMNMMRHCRQCRADAVGLLGEDRSAEFTTDKIMAMDVNYDLDSRKAYQAKVEEERVAKVAAKQEELATLAGEMSDIKLLTAVATKGSGLINEHFGHAKEFQVWELSTAAQSLSVIAVSIFIARVAMVRKIVSRRLSAPSMIVMPCSWLRSAAVRRAI